MKTLFVFMLIMGCLTVGCSIRQPIEAPGKNTALPPHFSEMAFEKIALDKTLKIDIDSGSESYVFDEGRSYFRAFRVPGGSENKSIDISSFCHGNFFPVYETIMYPFILTLDREFSVARKLLDGHVYEEYDSWKGICLKSTILLSQDEKYVIIYTSPLLLDRKHSFAMSYGKEKVVSGHSGTKYIPPSSVAGGRLVPYSMDGELEIRFTNR